MKTPRAPPLIAPSVAAAHRTPQDGRPSGTSSSDFPVSAFVRLTAHCHPARQCFKKTHFFGRFCGVRNASLRRTFCCVVHQKRDFKAHPAASSQHDSPRRLLLTRRGLSTLDSQPLNSRPRLALDSRLSKLAIRLPLVWTARQASSSTAALGRRKGRFDGRNQTIYRL